MGSHINIERAPEPSDILWENYGGSVVIWRRIFTGLITIILISLSAIVVYIASVYKKDLKQ
jgi:hypothetical protein